MKNTALILFAHGSSDPAWAVSLQQIHQQLVDAARPGGFQVALAFLERMTPTLDACMVPLAASGVTQVLIVPMFMAQGSHLKQDLPARVALLQQDYPHVRFELTPAVGEAAPVVRAIVDYALQQALALPPLPAVDDPANGQTRQECNGKDPTC